MLTASSAWKGGVGRGVEEKKEKKKLKQKQLMGREVGGGFRMGNTCTLMADSCQCMAKPTAIL